MLTAQDISKRFGLTLEDVCYMYSKFILPEPVRVGGDFRWRVEDIDLFENYLNERAECRERGCDPDAEDGPPVPVYSQGIPAMDPRQVMARVRERERRAKSRTLAAGTKPIPKQEPVVMPEVNTVEGK